jgi:hypothetical protein
MDTSQEYILMCEKAVEVQEGWESQVGDYGFLSHPLDQRIVFVAGEPWSLLTPVIFPFAIGNNKDLKRKENLRWLPRQDQLQGMVPEIKNKLHVIFRFIDFLQASYTKKTAQRAFVVLYNMLDNGASMEQLWMAFVMKEKYNKTWNGKDWEPTNDK